MKEGNKVRNQFEVNLRSVLSFREIGKGHDTIKTFSRCMNMYSISEPSYRKINEKLHETYELVANESMKKAAFEARGEENAPDVYSARISIDGTWQRRGHSSLNGVVTIISGGKCIDSMVMSKRCRGCAVWERKQGTAAYNAWKATHICRINHTKSSGAMESNGAVEMFHRSVEKNRLVYHEYLGDGDSSSFKDVVESKPYEAEFGITPNKLECVGHVNKRMGSRLRNLVKDHKGTERPLGGKQGKLTQKAINSMTNYYGRAIRYNVRTGNTNKEKVYGMKKWIAAILHHCTDFKNVQKRHMYCPPGQDSWCKFKKDPANAKHKVNLPEWMFPILEPVFKSLMDDDLLAKCTHGQTQNVNESINNIIWSRCPKRTYVERPQLELGVYSAIIQFNDGLLGLTNVFKLLKIDVGRCFLEASKSGNKKSLRNAKRKSTEKCIQRRKKLKAIRKGLADKEIELEGGESYVKGAF